MKILVVEDNEGLRQLLELELLHYGFDAMSAKTGVEALKLFKEQKPEIIILDIMLPQLDGFELLSSFRERDANVGIIVLSVLNTKEKRLKAFELGADDYMTKPFDVEELIARIEALGRRIRSNFTSEETILTDPLHINTSMRELEAKGEQVRLTKLEFDIFMLLYKNAGEVVNKEKLIEHIWGREKNISESVIPVYIKYLREKLSSLDIEIDTVRGIGYVLKI
ncbi:hypothetical protein AT15_04895 [Kosmotoga arenicorallina S304]|uniref:Response regulator ArlR n=1 Tax=Kosmotoga arenicorallina S304 TaxID=1453497 RepID=A0A176JWG3_9BACT|nr:response regulator transcription factor [Kosmotoga arenicorallina]OAA28024.1 hypothetical protein AT15_04895 [Kosmotoga arenicorallina S304]